MITATEMEAIVAKQLEQVTEWHKSDYEAPLDDEFESAATWLHHFNYELWHQEDLARDPDAADPDIAQVKRNIDKLNQKRNDMIETLDSHLVAMLADVKSTLSPDTKLNSETPGSMVDRLFINALKIYHMQEEVDREDAEEEHRAKCRGKVAVLHEQRTDLSNCLIEALDDLKHGRRRLKVYQQMKMYNDPSLNPVLYGNKEAK